MTLHCPGCGMTWEAFQHTYDYTCVECDTPLHRSTKPASHDASARHRDALAERSSRERHAQFELFYAARGEQEEREDRKERDDPSGSVDLDTALEAILTGAAFGSPSSVPGRIRMRSYATTSALFERGELRERDQEFD